MNSIFGVRVEIPRPPRIHLPIEDEKTVQSQSPGENTDSGRRQMTRLRADDFPMYSRKVFIGGLPHEINPRLITKFFERFGKNVVDWPHRECCDVKAPPNGYAFVIFNNEHAVRRLIYASDMKRGRLLVDLKLADNTTKTIQVRPWNLSFLRCSLVTLTPFLDRYSVFVGGVPRTTTAMELAHLFQQVINNVVEVSLEVEPGTNYPRGSARVVFGTREAYLVALAMRRFTLFTLKERRMLQMRPYVLDNVWCEICHESLGIYLCPELPCLLYYCVRCWFLTHHHQRGNFHKPVSRRTIGLLKNWGQNPNARNNGNGTHRGYFVAPQGHYH